MIFNLLRKLFYWLPDTAFLSLWYRKNMGYWPNLKEPKTFNEKLQWLKINDHNPKYTNLADKYLVRHYISDKIGSKYLIDLLGVWDNVDDINFESLPNEFVLKCTHDSGSVIICRDKENFNQSNAKAKLKKSMRRNSFDFAREWPYKDIIPKVIAERFLKQNNTLDGRIIDYKFFCFNGNPEFIYISKGLEHHPTAQISFYDFYGKQLPFRRSDYSTFDDAQLPINLNVMIELAKIVAVDVGCPFLRVDFYEVEGVIYFSEITFFPCSGVMPIVPQEWDKKIGDMISLPQDRMV